MVESDASTKTAAVMELIFYCWVSNLNLQFAVDSYLHGECFHKYGDLSKSALEEMVNCHSKWDRMMRQHGQGRQYRDDIRRLCFLFQLKLPQANELMWSAGQIFDFGDFRDYVLTDCLKRGIFDPDQVDEILKKEGLLPLFPDDNAKNRKIR